MQTYQNPTKVELGKKYQLDQSGLELHDIKNLIKEHQLLVLVMEGIGAVNLQVKLSDQKHILMQSQVRSESQDRNTIAPIDSSVLLTKEDLTLKITPVFQSKIQIEFLTMNEFDINFNKTYKVLSNMCSKIKFKFSNFFHTLKENKNNRIQFILRTSLQHQALKGYENLEMYINSHSKSFPSYKKFDLEASGNTGFGLIKTINNKSQYYCQDENCEYFITIYTENIEYIYFIPSILANGAELNFRSSLNILEELEEGEKLTYVLRVPKIFGNWLFRVVPQENSPQFFINPDKKQKFLKNYLLKSEEDGPSQILFTQQQMKQFGTENQTFYVTFKAPPKQPTTFQFHVEKLENPNMFLNLKENMTELGSASNQEIINYSLDLLEDEPYFFSIMIESQAFDADVEMYLKECSFELTCQITDNDIKQAAQNPQNNIIRKAVASQKKNQDHLVTENKLLLNLNCVGEGFLFQHERKKGNKFQQSKTCKFAIGLKVLNSKNQFARYRLKSTGMKLAKPLSLNKSHNLVVETNGQGYYFVNLDRQDKQKNLVYQVKIVVLSGKGTLFLSNFQQKPSKEDFDEKIDYNNKHVLDLESQVYEKNINISQQNKDKIYVGIFAKEYSVLDIYIKPLSLTKQDEQIFVEKIMKRIIKKDDSQRIGAETVFYQSFFFEPSQEYIKASKFIINIDSHVYGLSLCVQFNKKLFDPHQECDLTSDNENLEVTRNGSWQYFSIGVKKQLKKFEVFENFPIEFHIHISSDLMLSVVTLHEPGKIHSNMIQGKSKIIYQVDISQMRDSFLVLLSTNAISLIGSVYSSRKSSSLIGTLDRHNIGMQQTQGELFKMQNCKAQSCFVYVHLFNNDKEPQSYVFTYTIDTSPIHLQSGKEIFVPGNLPQNFLMDVSKNDPVSFFFESSQSSLVAYAKVWEQNKLKRKNLRNFISEYNFEFKTNIEKSDEIIIPVSEMASFTNPVTIFSLIPKLDYAHRSYGQNAQIFLRDSMVRVTAHQGIEKLEPFKEASKQMQKGDLHYYSLFLEKGEGFTLFISVSVGKVKLVMNQGFNNLPTKNQFWKEIKSLRGGEIVVNKKDLENNQHFTVGVFAEENAKFQINFMPDFHNLISLKYQQLTEKTLKKDKVYYFDFYNKRRNFHSIFYAKNSDVELSVLEYSKLLYQDFMTVLKNEDNYLQKFVFKKGDVPRKKMSQVELNKFSHYVIRMKALNDDAKVFFLLYDPARPIKVSHKSNFYFTLDANDEQIFEIDYHNQYFEIDVTCKLQQGHIEYAISDNPDQFGDFKEMKDVQQSSQSFTLEQNTQDIIIFNQIFIKVKAWELSSFSCSTKPQEEFKEILPSETELLFLKPQEDTFVYFEIGENDLDKKYKIDLYLENSYQEKPELLFSGDQEVSLNKTNKFLPMALEDYNEKQEDMIRHIQIKPQVHSGSFIVKFQNVQQRLPVKIALSIDNEHQLDLNGIFKNFLSKKETLQQFSMFIPTPGEFRLITDICSRAKIQSATFYNNQVDEEIKFEDNYAQAYPFIFEDLTENKSFKDFKNLIVPIRRGSVSNSGILKFDVQLDRAKKQITQDQYFYLLSEFRPRNKELILKDYIDLWGDRSEVNTLQYSYSFNLEETSLKVEIMEPKFKDQLLLDYPKIKKIKVVYLFYLVRGEEFYDKFMQCGFSSLTQFESVERRVQHYITKENINVRREKFNVHFQKEHLKNFMGDKNLQLYARMNLYFIENEEDVFNISLNTKFTSVPFFIIKFPNKFLSGNWVRNILILSFIALALFLIYKFLCTSQKQLEPEISYSKPEKKSYAKVQKEEFGQIEMY